MYNSKNKQLLENPLYILKCGNITYGETPKQEVATDCALYGVGVGTVLHLAISFHFKDTISNQSTITYLRKSIYIIFNAPPNEISADPKEFISCEFLSSFFQKAFETNNNKPNLLFNT